MPSSTLSEPISSCTFDSLATISWSTVRNTRGERLVAGIMCDVFDLVGTGISRHFQSESAVIVASGTQLDLRVLLSGDLSTANSALYTRRLPCIGDSAHKVLGHQQVENSVGGISEKKEKRADTRHLAGSDADNDKEREIRAAKIN